jgi:hypothetical protein
LKHFNYCSSYKIAKKNRKEQPESVNQSPVKPLQQIVGGFFGNKNSAKIGLFAHQRVICEGGQLIIKLRWCMRFLTCFVGAGSVIGVCFLLL